MSNLARKLQQQQQEQKHSQPLHPPKKQSVKQTRISPGESVLWIALALMACFGGVKIINNEAQIDQVNRDVQKIQTSIHEQSKVNEDLKVQVGELSTYERIWQKAKERGLLLDENNVKVVQER